MRTTVDVTFRDDGYRVRNIYIYEIIIIVKDTVQSICYSCKSRANHHIIGLIRSLVVYTPFFRRVFSRKYLYHLSVRSWNGDEQEYKHSGRVETFAAIKISYKISRLRAKFNPQNIRISDSDSTAAKY